jgi:hypothetical protein
LPVKILVEWLDCVRWVAGETETALSAVALGLRRASRRL